MRRVRQHRFTTSIIVVAASSVEGGLEMRF